MLFSLSKVIILLNYFFFVVFLKEKIKYHQVILCHMGVLLIYLIYINLFSAVLFSYDKVISNRKKKAFKRKKVYRISEIFLHFLESVGGCFFILPLIFILRHKNRKQKYYIITMIFFFIWLWSFKHNYLTL